MTFTEWLSINKRCNWRRYEYVTGEVKSHAGVTNGYFTSMREYILEARKYDDLYAQDGLFSSHLNRLHSLSKIMEDVDYEGKRYFPTDEAPYMSYVKYKDSILASLPEDWR